MLSSKSQALLFQVHVVADVRGHRGSAAVDGRGDTAEEQSCSGGKLRPARRSTLRTAEIKISTCVWNCTNKYKVLPQITFVSLFLSRYLPHRVRAPNNTLWHRLCAVSTLQCIMGRVGLVSPPPQAPRKDRPL